MASKKTKKRRAVLIILALIIFISIFAFDARLSVTEYTLESDKLTDSFTAVLITDLHSCKYGDGQIKLINAVKNASPDVIFLSGDIVDDKLPRTPAYEFLREVSADYPCFYVSGNHEFWSNDISTIKADISDLGISVLEGDSVSPEFSDNVIICGIDDPDVGEGEFSRQLENCASSVSNDAFTILLSHRPERISQYASYGFDTVLSGHAHGGQVRLPVILEDGLFAPNQGFFPKYTCGVHEYNNTNLIISRGLARESTRLPRIFNRPELVVVKFSPQA